MTVWLVSFWPTTCLLHVVIQVVKFYFCTCMCTFLCSVHLHSSNTSPARVQLRCRNVMLITLGIIFIFFFFFRAVTFICQLQCNYANDNPMTHWEWCRRRRERRGRAGGSICTLPNEIDVPPSISVGTASAQHAGTQHITPKLIGSHRGE